MPCFPFYTEKRYSCLAGCRFASLKGKAHLIVPIKSNPMIDDFQIKLRAINYIIWQNIHKDSTYAEKGSGKASQSLLILCDFIMRTDIKWLP